MASRSTLSHQIVSAGAKAYFFDADTTTPRTTYQDAAATTPHAHPVVADSAGRFPAIFLQYGDYRERVVTSADVLIWDTNDIPNPEPPDSGGGGGIVVSSEMVLTTGDVIWRPQTGTRSGFVRGNGRTIGNAASGATERANSDTSALFEFLWNNLSDTVCPVSGGRGATAAADYAANKTIGLPDWRGRALFGLDDMGASAAGRLTTATITAPTTPGSSGGAETVTLTVAQMPAHDHSGTSGNAGAHNHGLSGNIVASAGSAGNANLQAAGGAREYQAFSAATDHAHTIPSQGGGSAHSNMPPAVVGTYYIRL